MSNYLSRHSLVGLEELVLSCCIAPKTYAVKEVITTSILRVWPARLQSGFRSIRGYEGRRFQLYMIQAGGVLSPAVLRCFSYIKITAVRVVVHWLYSSCVIVHPSIGVRYWGAEYVREHLKIMRGRGYDKVMPKKTGGRGFQVARRPPVASRVCVRRLPLLAHRPFSANLIVTRFRAVSSLGVRVQPPFNAITQYSPMESRE
jgi:hypothetical protein